MTVFHDPCAAGSSSAPRNAPAGRRFLVGVVAPSNSTTASWKGVESMNGVHHFSSLPIVSSPRMSMAAIARSAKPRQPQSTTFVPLWPLSVELPGSPTPSSLITSVVESQVPHQGLNLLFFTPTSFYSIFCFDGLVSIVYGMLITQPPPLYASLPSR